MKSKIRILLLIFGLITAHAYAQEVRNIGVLFDSLKVSPATRAQQFDAEKALRYKKIATGNLYRSVCFWEIRLLQLSDYRVLAKHAKDEIMLIAHSMGSIIAIDVLSFINQNTKINTLVTMGAPLGAPFVISRIAAHSKSSYGKIRFQTPESVQNKWLNFSDIRDNIAVDYKLSDDFSPNSKNVKCIDKLVTNNYVMNGVANPHKSYGYLRTPEFIEALVEFIKQ